MNGPIEQSSSSSSSSEAGYSKHSSSDENNDRKEPKEAEVNLEKLLMTSSYVFVNTHYSISEYDLKRFVDKQRERQIKLGQMALDKENVYNSNEKTNLNYKKRGSEQTTIKQ